MARTIAEIQQEIFIEKEKYSELVELNSDSKSAIWRLWIYIVSAAIWMHEKIVEKNALLSRPHTLNWYREQALNYIHGADLIWEEGYFQFEKIPDAESKKIIKHCAVSERLYEDIEDGEETDPDRLADLISEFYYNQVGIIFMKVAKQDGDDIVPLLRSERRAFRAYMNEIKDAGTQIKVLSTIGDTVYIEVDVYVDPLIIYTEGDNKGKLVRDLSIAPVETAIKNYLSTLEFNGSFVPTFLTDQIQKSEGVNLPILRKIIANFKKSDLPVDEQPSEDISNNKNRVIVLGKDDRGAHKEYPFFIPVSGYFDVNKSIIKINYRAYNLQTDASFDI